MYTCYCCYKIARTNDPCQRCHEAFLMGRTKGRTRSPRMLSEQDVIETFALDAFRNYLNDPEGLYWAMVPSESTLNPAIVKKHQRSRARKMVRVFLGEKI